MVVRLLSKARILAELHVLSKAIILELISSFKSIRLVKFLTTKSARLRDTV